MAKKYIIWVSNKSTDPLAHEKAEELKNVLDGEWNGNISTAGTLGELNGFITGMLPYIDESDDILIYVHDVGQLSPEPSICDNERCDTLKNIIDDKFYPETFEHLTFVMTGVRSCVCAHDVGQLSDGTKKFTLCGSMATHQELIPDNFDIAWRLPGTGTTWSDLLNAITEELNHMASLPDELKQFGCWKHFRP